MWNQISFCLVCMWSQISFFKSVHEVIQASVYFVSGTISALALFMRGTYRLLFCLYMKSFEHFSLYMEPNQLLFSLYMESFQIFWFVHGTKSASVVSVWNPISYVDRTKSAFAFWTWCQTIVCIWNQISFFLYMKQTHQLLLFFFYIRPDQCLWFVH